MNYNAVLNRVIKKTKMNSPEIMTALAAGGVIATAYLSAKGAFRASKKLNEWELDNYDMDHRDLAGIRTIPEEDTLLNRVKVVWPEFVPAAIVGGTTIACVLGSHRVHTRRTAAAVAAYSLTERAFAEYRAKVEETLGKNKAEKVQAAVVEEQMQAVHPHSQAKEIIVAAGGESLCCDLTTGRYFESDMQTLKAAVNRVNERLLKERWMSVKEFYHEIEVYPNHHIDNLGWDLETGLMDLVFTPTLTDKGVPCLAFTFNYTKPL